MNPTLARLRWLCKPNQGTKTEILDLARQWAHEESISPHELLSRCEDPLRLRLQQVAKDYIETMMEPEERGFVVGYPLPWPETGSPLASVVTREFIFALAGLEDPFNPETGILDAT